MFGAVFQFTGVGIEKEYFDGLIYFSHFTNENPEDVLNPSTFVPIQCFLCHNIAFLEIKY